MDNVCKTWKQTENLPRTAQKINEKAMFGVTLRDRYRSTWIRAETTVNDIILVTKIAKIEMGRAVS